MSEAAAPRGRTAVVVLAGSLLAVELLAGMQRYLSQTVLPLLADELDGKHLYGLLDAAAQAPMFLTMPLGAWLMSRFNLSRLMLGLTMLTIAGAVVCAAAPSMAVFIAGTAIRAAASGALGAVGMGAISRGLPPKYRQIVIAGMSGVWVISSVIGPVYAVALSSIWSWRWAMVAYLPLLVVARFMIARHLPERQPNAAEKAPWAWALVLSLGSVVLSLPAGAWSIATVLTGAALMLWAVRAILPHGTLTAPRGRRAALSALMVSAAVYFGASMVLSVVAHDGFGLTAGKFGFIIAAPGFIWALVALWTGSHPASESGFGRRALLAGGLIAAGVAVLAVTTLVADGAFIGFLCGAAILGLGMGTIYPDLLGRCLSEPAPEHSDGITQDQMATAVVLSETVGMSLATTLAYTWIATGFAVTEGIDARSAALYLALLPFAALMLLRLRAAAR